MPGISAVSPPISAQPAWRQPSAIEATTAAATVVVELPASVIIEEEQRLGALDDEVVGAHRDQVDADAVVAAELDRQLELGPDAVVGGDQQRIVIARRLQIEEAAESAKLGVGAGPRGRAGERADRLDQRVAGLDRHAGIGIGQGLFAHRERPVETSRLDFHAVVAKSGADAPPAISHPICCCSPLRSAFRPALYAQLETGDRGILPIDSSGTLEITGIHVDVGGTDAQSARYAGWRIAQRVGFRALWAKTHNAPINQAPNLPDSTLDQIVSSINVEREEIGPNRYIATSASCSTARAPRNSSASKGAKSGARCRCC